MFEGEKAEKEKNSTNKSINTSSLTWSKG